MEGKNEEETVIPSFDPRIHRHFRLIDMAPTHSMSDVSSIEELVTGKDVHFTRYKHSTPRDVLERSYDYMLANGLVYNNKSKNEWVNIELKLMEMGGPQSFANSALMPDAHQHGKYPGYSSLMAAYLAHPEVHDVPFHRAFVPYWTDAAKRAAALAHESKHAKMRTEQAKRHHEQTGSTTRYNDDDVAQVIKLK